jgi:hypothetical protein
MTVKAASAKGLTYLPKHGDQEKILVNHPVADLCELCLTLTIANRTDRRAIALLKFRIIL